MKIAFADFTDAADASWDPIVPGAPSGFQARVANDMHLFIVAEFDPPVADKLFKIIQDFVKQVKGS